MGIYTTEMNGTTWFMLSKEDVIEILNGEISEKQAEKVIDYLDRNVEYLVVDAAESLLII